MFTQNNNMRKTLYILICSMALILCSCDKDTEPSNIAPELTTHAATATDIQRTEVTLSGIIKRTNGSQIIECGIMYSQQENFAVSNTSQVDTSTDGEFSVQITGLTPDQTYYYCTYAKSGYSTVKGNVEEFHTSPITQPLFEVVQVSNITQTGLDVSVRLSDTGGANIRECGFVYMATNENVNPDALAAQPLQKAEADANGEYKLAISRLSPDTRYAICPYARYAKTITDESTDYGDVVYATTLKAEKPVVSATVINDKEGIKSLQLSASVRQSGTTAVTERGFVYSMDNQIPAINEERTSKIIATGDNDGFQATLPELLYNKTYYIRAYAINDFGTGYGDVLTYTTDNYSFPIVITAAATDIGEDFATLNGEIEDDGNSPILLRGFVWSATNPTPTIEDNRIESSISTPTFSARLTEGLSSAQTYYYRAYAVNGKGPGYGSVKTFTTIQTYPPTLSATVLSGISATTVTASSAVSDDGGSAILEKGFVFSGTASLPTLSDTKVISTSDNNSIVLLLSDLTDNTRYYIRSFATNKKGTSYGAVQTFTTLSKDEVTSIEKGDFSEDENW